MNPRNVSRGREAAFYGHLDNSIIILANDHGRTWPGSVRIRRTKSRSSIHCFTPVFFDICGFFLACRIRSLCACDQLQCPTSLMREFRPEGDHRPKK